MPLAATTAAVLTAAGSLLAMCAPPPPSGPDTSPPSVALDVNGIPGSSILTVPAAGVSRTLPRTATIDLIASGTDAQSGIDFVAIRGEIRKTCVTPDGEVGQTRTATVLKRVPAGPSPGATLTTRIVTLSVGFGYVGCSSGFRPVAMSGELHASATNEVGLTSNSGTFEFSFTV
jgi:hypothetical protein